MHPAVVWSMAVLTSVAAVSDLRDRRIPNWLTGGGVAAGFLLQGTVAGWPGVRNACFGCALALLVYIALFALRAIGGGDVKLMAAVGSLAGPQNWLVIFVLASITGGIWALFLIFARGAVGQAVVNTLHVLAEAGRLRPPYRDRPELDIGHPKALSVPHGAAIAVGILVFLMFG
jgi:prepilin peptidase CpaA